MPSTISAGTTAGTAIAIAGDTTGNLAFQTNGTTTAMTINTSQNILVGTTNSDVGGSVAGIRMNQAGDMISCIDGSGLLHYQSPVAADRRNTAGDGVMYGMWRAGIYQCGIGATNGSAMTFFTGNNASQTERMRITSGGNVLVGATALTTTEQMLIQSAVTTNSRITLTVYNTTATSTTRASSTLIRVLGNGTSADASMVFSDNSTYNVFMGGNNGQAFVIANTGGVFLGSGSTSWSGISDARLKNVTGTYTNALNDIAQLEPVKFTWKSDATNKPQVGLIAQSVQKVVPEAVEATFEGDDPTEYLGVRYTEVIPLLVASIQELKGIVETQKTELDALKAEVAALKQGA